MRVMRAMPLKDVGDTFMFVLMPRRCGDCTCTNACSDRSNCAARKSVC
jgi:hypothetical protein